MDNQGSANSGTPIVQAFHNASNSQAWRIDVALPAPTVPICYQVVGMHGGQYLDNNDDPNDGRQMIQSANTGKTSQKWVIERHASAWDYCIIKPAGATHFCLSNNSSLNETAPILQTPPAGLGTATMWRISRGSQDPDHF